MAMEMGATPQATSTSTSPSTTSQRRLAAAPDDVVERGDGGHGVHQVGPCSAGIDASSSSAFGFPAGAFRAET